jgi:hypothetical protein
VSLYYNMICKSTILFFFGLAKGDNLSEDQVSKLADNPPPCPVAPESDNGYCKGFKDGWNSMILERGLDTVENDSPAS